MKKTYKKLIILLVVGFFAGAVLGNVIALIIGLLSGSDGGIVARELSGAIGQAGAIILQTIICGVFGLVSVGGMYLYEIDSWSLFTATLVHFLSIAGCYVGASVILYWLPPLFIYYLISIGAMAVGFAIIWLIMYFRWKKDVKDMNNDLEKYKENVLNEKSK